MDINIIEIHQNDLQKNIFIIMMASCFFIIESTNYIQIYLNRNQFVAQIIYPEEYFAFFK
jgi:hypothetical protein